MGLAQQLIRGKVSAVAMHANWNPWHGCIKCSEGCENCYVYYLDALYGKSAAEIHRTKGSFSYPLARDKNRRYKLQSGEMLSVCMTSDFFLEEADQWRDEAWDIIRQRKDLAFRLLTKRPERIASCLPSDWGAGWPHVFLNVSCENQTRADERIPILLELPFAHKGVQLAPLLGPIQLGAYLASGQIELVTCGGENYGGQRPCDFSWVRSLRDECASHNVSFCFMETGTIFIKDGRRYTLKSKQLQNSQAYKSGMSYQGKEIRFEFTDALGLSIPEEELYKRQFCEACNECSFKPICNGCNGCPNCKR